MARWVLYTGWMLYTGQLSRKYKATENFGKLSSDHNIQGDRYIQGRYIQVWPYYPFKGPLEQEGAHTFPTLMAFWVRFCIFFVLSLLPPSPPPRPRRFNSPLLMVTNKILFFLHRRSWYGKQQICTCKIVYFWVFWGDNKRKNNHIEPSRSTDIQL